VSINLNNFDVWQGWSQNVPAPDVDSNPQENHILRVAYNAIDEVIDQFMRGPKKGYNTENPTTDPDFVDQLHELKNNSWSNEYHGFSFEYYLPALPDGLDGIKVEIKFYHTKDLVPGFTKLAVIDIDDLTDHQWVIGN